MQNFKVDTIIWSGRPRPQFPCGTPLTQGQIRMERWTTLSKGHTLIYGVRFDVTLDQLSLSSQFASERLVYSRRCDMQYSPPEKIAR